MATNDEAGVGNRGLPPFRAPCGRRPPAAARRREERTAVGEFSLAYEILRAGRLGGHQCVAENSGAAGPAEVSRVRRVFGIVEDPSSSRRHRRDRRVTDTRRIVTDR